MPYEYLDHTADLGVRGIGTTPEQAFSEAARAMLAAMFDVGSVQLERALPLRCTALDIPALFVAWLNEILYLCDVNEMLFAEAHVIRLWHEPMGWTLEAVVSGEKLDPRRHETYTEVKAATYAGLDFRHEGGQYTVQCLLDL